LYLICSPGFKQNSYDFFGREVQQTTTDDTDDADWEVIPGEFTRLLSATAKQARRDTKNLQPIRDIREWS